MRESLKVRWAHHRNLLSRGQSEISIFYGVVSMSLLLWLTLRDMFTIPREWVVFVLPCIILSAGAAQYIVGYLIWKWDLIKAYQKWDSEQNPVLTDILENTSENSVSRKHEGHSLPEVE